MNTIRQLCTRCIVLDRGRIIYDGDVDTAIEIYMENNMQAVGVEFDLSQKRMAHLPPKSAAKMIHLQLLNKTRAVYKSGEMLAFQLKVRMHSDIPKLYFRFEVRYADDLPVGTAQCPLWGSYSAGDEVCAELQFLTQGLTRGKYKVLFVLYGMNEFGTYEDYDAIWPAFTFEIEDSNTINWNANMWGHIQFPDIKIIDISDNNT